MAEEIVIDIDIDKGGNAAKSLKQLKTEFKEQQKALEGLQVGSKEYVAQLKKLGEIKDDIGDLNSEIAGLGSNEGKIKAVGNVVSGLAGGFAAATGAAALFGAESEETEKALLKVQAAMAMAQGIEQVLSLGDAFKVLKNIILANPLFALATVIVTLVTAFVGLDTIIAGVKEGFKAMGDAAMAVWDGIVEGIKFAIDIYTQYLDLITFGLFDLNGAYKSYIKNIEDANEAERKRLEALKKEGEAISENIKAINEQIKATKEAYKAVEEREKLVTRAYDNEIKLAKAAGRDTEQLEKDKLEFVRKSIEEKIKLQLKEFELTQKLSEEILALQQNQAAQGNNVNAQLLAAANKAAENQKKENKKVLDELKLQLEDVNVNIEVAEAESLKRRQEKYKEYLDNKKKLDEEALKAKSDLEEVYAKMDADFKAQVEKDLLETKKTLKEEEAVINFDALEQNVKQTEDASLKDAETYLKNQELFKQTQDAKVQIMSDSINLLSSITELFANKNEQSAKRAFEIQKALSIADAIIKTYQSANAVFASASANPITIGFPAFPFIQAGLAVAAGIANVAKIAQTKFEGGSSPSAPSVGSPSSGGGAPQTGSGNEINTTQLDRQRIESGQSDNRVYVVESDITQSQKRISGIINRATIQ